MNEITVRRRDVDIGAFVKRSAQERDFDLLIRGETVLRDAESGEVVGIYAFLPPAADELAGALRRIQYLTNERVGGLKTTSRIFGAMPRIELRSDFCRMAGLAKDDPAAHALLEAWGEAAEAHYRAQAPERHARHLAMTERVLPAYRMRETAFTSGIVNRNNPLKYHYDRGNFDGVFSCMIGFKDGIMGGVPCHAGVRHRARDRQPQRDPVRRAGRSPWRHAHHEAQGRCHALHRRVLLAAADVEVRTARGGACAHPQEENGAGTKTARSGTLKRL